MTDVVAALVWRGNEFMICQRPEHKKRGLLWEFVGGKVEEGESKEQALVRECREELDVTVIPGDIFTQVDYVYPDITIHLTLFNAVIENDEAPKLIEHCDIRWISPEEIDDYDFCPADEEILALIKKRAHLKNVVAVISQAQREAARLMLHAGKIVAVNKSSSRDVMTEYDARVQQHLIERLSQAFPGAHFFCEEKNEQQSLDSDMLFIIDPIDGTMNFMHGHNHSCISVGYAEKNEMMAGCIYDPYMDEMFTAIKGEGAYLNGVRTHVDDCPLKETVVCCGTAPYQPELADTTFSIMKKAFLNSLDIRRGASAALDLCFVAAGRAGLYEEPRVCYWDYAAGMLLVTEAGGVVRTLDNTPLPCNENKTSIVAGSKQAVEAFFRLCV